MISAVILTKNDQKTIAACLTSVAWCDEVIVIDDYSTDKTIDIVQSAHAEMYKHSLAEDFSQQRNYGLAKAKHEWILFVDADEEVSISLQYEITHHIANQFHIYNGFLLKRIDELWKRKLLHGETGNIQLLRLGRKDSGIWEGKVHEVWKIKGKTTTLQNPLYHFPHQNISSFLRDINYYSDLRAKELLKMKRSVKPWQIIAYPVGKFIYTYFILLGFLDGIPGMILAVMMSLHSFLVRGKVWLAYEKQK